MPFPDSLGRSLNWKIYALLALVAAALFLPGFVGIPPVDRDEPRFAEASRQMLLTGDWIDIRYQDEARNKKPVGIYWLQASSAWLADQWQTGADRKIWPYRIPSLLGAIAAIWLTARLGALLFSAEAGIAAALLLACSLLLNSEARLAKTDSVLLALVLAAQFALARAASCAPTGQERCRPPAWNWLLFWGALGCGIMVKGPIILMTSGLTCAGLWLLERRDKKSRAWLKTLRPLPGLALALAIVLPWLMAIALRTHGAFFAESVGHDLLGKVAHGQDRGALDPGLYLVSLPLILWPGSLALLWAAPWIWAHKREPAVAFCLVWSLPYWFLFECFPTKLPHYMLPICPALLLLAAAALTRPAIETLERRRVWRLLAALVWLVYTCGLLAVAAGLPLLADGHAPSPLALAAFAGVAALAFAAAFAWPDLGRVCALLLVMALVTHGMLFGLTIPDLSSPWISSKVAARLATIPDCASPFLVTVGYEEPSLVFLAGGQTRFFGNGDLAADFMMLDTAASHAPCRLALVAATRDSLFRRELDGFHERPDVLAHIGGLNYGHGQPTTLTLYRLTPSGP